MKKFFLAFLPFLLYASVIDDYKEKKYDKICVSKNLNTSDEKILSLVGISCVKSDKLYLLPFIINKLKKTRLGRTNSVYFSTIVLQKKLLYGFLFDGFSIKGFSFPKGDYILSVVFDNIKKGNYIFENGIYIINLSQKIIYFYKNGDKMIIDEYKNGKLISSKWFR